MIITGGAIYDVWVKLLTKLHESNNIVYPRGKKNKEIIGVRLEVTDGLANIIHDHTRNINYRFMVAEWIWMLFGLAEVAPLARYNGKISEFSDDGKLLAGAYGPRLFPQWPYVFNKLYNDLDSRQAVMSIWTPRGPGEHSKDVPCTLSFQFLVRDHTPLPRLKSKLHMIVTMRSSDVWLGIPYDFFSFSMLANQLASALTHIQHREITLGSIILNLGSSHLYEENWEAAKKIIDGPTGRTIRSARLPVGANNLPPGLDSVLLDPNCEPQPTFPFPYENYKRVLKSPSSADALIELIKIDGWEDKLENLATE